MAGSILGKYQLERIIGRGGMSDVYRARHSSMDREVAVKVLHRHLSVDGAFVVRFQREASLMARLRHPHIVQVLDFGHENGAYYIVLERPVWASRGRANPGWPKAVYPATLKGLT